MIDIPASKFTLGRIVQTPGAAQALKESGQSSWEFIFRHMGGDWGEVCEEDGQLNDAALEDGSRVLSAYKTAKGERLWIITESDRSVTTLLLPEEY